MALWRESDPECSFLTLFPKHFSYLCEYAFICELSCSFCEYPIIFHCLHCSPSCFDPESSSLCILLAWAILECLGVTVFHQNQSFSSPKTISRNPYTNSKQQERQNTVLKTLQTFLAVDTHKQAGRQSTALTGASSRSCHVTKRFRILATLKQGNKSM